MMSDAWQKRVGIALVLASLSATRIASALNEGTHALVNQIAGQYEGLDGLLQRSLGLRDGRTTLLRGRTVVGWLGEGGAREDDGIRFLRHFHDPLKASWAFSGLGGAFASSVQWMQQPHQEGPFYPSWSWSDARRFYLEALTERDARTREQAAADLFRALGQVMHLVVDASVPEHSRNDPHLGGFVERQIFRNPRYGNYEYWVSDQHTLGTTPAAREVSAAQFTALYLSAPIGFDPSILRTPTLDDIATVPIARLIDTKIYRGAGSPSVTLFPTPGSPAIGLAEFSNANFFSQDTLRDQYPYPLSENLPRSVWATRRGRVRAYFAKRPGDGLAVDPVRAECITEQMAVRIQVPFRCQDETVWRQTALHMLPRAVGYARGALEYFFRGSATITNVHWTPTGISLTLTNTGSEEMEGVFEIYARHNPGTAAERRVKLATLGKDQPILLAPGEAWTFSDAITVSADAVPTPAHVLVFRGRIGLEEGAIAGNIFLVPYVEVRQTTYDAGVTPDCRRLPPGAIPPPYRKGVTMSIRSDSMRCEWRIVSHRVSGIIETNMPVDPEMHRREPIIDRIEAQWFGGDAEGPAPLMLDGRPVGAVWQRQGTEPDPTTYEIVDPTDRSRSYLYLVISYKNGGQLETQQAIFTRGRSTHGKTIWIDNTNPNAPRYLVSSGRGVTDVLAYNWAIDGQMLRPLFEPLTIGGKPVPTDTRVSHPFGGIRVTEGLLINAESYNDSVNDHFEIFTIRQPANAVYEGIEPLLGPHPEGPFFTWVAQLQRVYQPMEREFLRAFVTATPAPFQVRLTAQ